MTTLAPPRPVDTASRRPPLGELWRITDPLLVLAAAALTALGAVMVYSSTRVRLAEAGAAPTALVTRHLVFIGVAVVGGLIVSRVDHRVIAHVGWIAYAGALVALVAVLTPVFGSSAKGAQAWFQVGPFRLQPAEIAKVVVVVALASVAGGLSRAPDARDLVRLLAVPAVPTALILAQPDLGTALVFGAITLGVLVAAGTRGKHLAVLVAAGVVAVGVVLQAGMLEDYQKARLTSFIDPAAADLRQDAYNLEQSRIAIGSGGVWGKGLFEGTQTSLSYVPEQHTDFIFTAVGEELGLVGGATVVALYGIILWRIWQTAARARDATGRLLAVGVFSMLLFQVFQNMGMTMGIMPITGIPLPFMSFGGTAMIASWAAVGVVLSVRRSTL